MTAIHIVAISISIVLLLVGSYGFLQKKWNFWAVFVIYWFAVSLFCFGILPSQFPDWSLARQVTFSTILSIASFIVVGMILKRVLARKEK